MKAEDRRRATASVCRFTRSARCVFSLSLHSLLDKEQVAAAATRVNIAAILQDLWLLHFSSALTLVCFLMLKGSDSPALDSVSFVHKYESKNCTSSHKTTRKLLFPLKLIPDVRQEHLCRNWNKRQNLISNTSITPTSVP